MKLNNFQWGGFTMSVTISDIAKRANVSPATVSRVLNCSGYVKEETKKRILEAIKETKESTKNASKNLEVTSKKQPTIITPPPILDTSSNILALILNAEKEMFVGVNS